MNAPGEGPEPPPGSGAADPSAVSAYVAELCEELAGMAEKAKLPFLAYLLSMAQGEAQRIRHAHARK